MLLHLVCHPIAICPCSCGLISIWSISHAGPMTDQVSCPLWHWWMAEWSWPLQLKSSGLLTDWQQTCYTLEKWFSHDLNTYGWLNAKQMYRNSFAKVLDYISFASSHKMEKYGASTYFSLGQYGSDIADNCHKGIHPNLNFRECWSSIILTSD